ncbi:universal stress protein [Amycolatopsis rhabdoformis]|uniref:Universal stress protein n=1 Tax=Amycolatopsis rhabdoformis TaxID=1448059 RepID=A0ABZ1IEC0_9PSEU|nr:universal stress protein [Amycolatopsis rhabdoformis]WSE32033.1 universal stress protein [Amycolatopsis rhabdoformis]
MANASSELVVGIDGSESALTAVRWAARMARERRFGVRLVHAVDEIPETYPHAAPTYEDAQQFVGERSAQVIEQAKAAVTEVAPGVAVDVVLRPEQPAAALRAESATAAMVVLGTRGLHRLGRVVLGSVSVSLASHAECPVAFVRPRVAEDEPPVDGPVVVGVDGTPVGEEALAAAFEEASWRGSGLVALHCWKEGFLASVFESGRADADEIEARERELLAERLAGWQAKYPDVQVERLVVKERPADGLLDWADRAQLLVVGSRGRGGLAGLALGSTSQSLISYALCPVLVVRGTRPASRDE